MKKVIILLLGVFTLISCGEKKDSQDQKNNENQAELEVKTAYEKHLQVVLDEHDVLMAEMKTVSGLLQKVEAETETAEEDAKEVYLKSAEKLQKANKSMFSWMKDFSEEFPDIHEKEKTFSEEEYKERVEKLKAQEELLEKLKKEFEEGISSAETLLNN